MSLLQKNLTRLKIDKEFETTFLSIATRYAKKNCFVNTLKTKNNVNYI
jgi:hypothetical protein